MHNEKIKLWRFTASACGRSIRCRTGVEPVKTATPSCI